MLKHFRSDAPAGPSTQDKGKQREGNGLCRKCRPTPHSGECRPVCPHCRRRHLGDCHSLCDTCQTHMHPADSPNCQGFPICKRYSTRHHHTTPHRQCTRCARSTHYLNACTEGGLVPKTQEEQQLLGGKYSNLGNATNITINYYPAAKHITQVNSGRGELARPRGQGNRNRNRNRNLGGGRNAETKKGVGATSKPKSAAESSQEGGSILVSEGFSLSVPLPRWQKQIRDW